jgi:hypothetical protein
VAWTRAEAMGCASAPVTRPSTVAGRAWAATDDGAPGALTDADVDLDGAIAQAHKTQAVATVNARMRLLTLLGLSADR